VDSRRARGGHREDLIRRSDRHLRARGGPLRSGRWSGISAGTWRFRPRRGEVRPFAARFRKPCSSTSARRKATRPGRRSRRAGGVARIDQRRPDRSLSTPPKRAVGFVCPACAKSLTTTSSYV
jgi:hypothetical protein